MMNNTLIIFAAVAAILLAAGPEPAYAQPEPRTVTVRGTGTVSVRPDEVRISMQVMTRAESASAAMSEAGGRTRTVIALLQSYGVAEKDIQTRRMSVSPEYDREKRTSPPKISGYVALTDMSAVFRESSFEKLGEFLDKAVAAGVTNIGGLEYQTSDRAAHEQKALGEAAKDAKIRAERLASQLGARVGKVVSITESGIPVPGPRMDLMAMSESGSPVMAGELDVVVRVDAVFELLQNKD